MTLTIQQLQEKAQTLDPNTIVCIRGLSGEEYTVKNIDIVADGNILLIAIQDELEDGDDDSEE